MAKKNKGGAKRAETSAAPIEETTTEETPVEEIAEEPSPIEETPEETPVEEKPECGFYVAEGKSLTSKKGPVAANDKVTAANWDEDTLKRLVASGAVIEIK